MNERDIIASTYFHRISEQLRQIESETEWGETTSELKIIKTDIKCSISKGSLNEINIDKGIQTLTSTYTLFISDLEDVQTGDLIVVDGKTFEIGDVFTYEGSHAEAHLKASQRV